MVRVIEKIKAKDSHLRSCVLNQKGYDLFIELNLQERSLDEILDVFGKIFIEDRREAKPKLRENNYSNILRQIKILFYLRRANNGLMMKDLLGYVKESRSTIYNTLERLQLKQYVITVSKKIYRRPIIIYKYNAP